jgi:hypothetical protein
MSGFSSALGHIAIAKQTAKGSPAAVPTKKFKLAAAPSLHPVKERARYAATDIGRDPGPAYTARLGVAGDFQVYAEPQAMALLWYLVLGANADAGAGPDYTHTATPANDLPYCTIWRSVGGNVFEKFTDCKLGRLAIAGGAGSPFTVTLGVEGIQSGIETAETALAALELAGYLFPEIQGLLQFDAAVQRVHRVEFEINNNIGAYQADDYIPFEIDVGKRELGLTVALRFAGRAAFPDYQDFFYGAAAPQAALTPVVDTHSFEFTMRRAANIESKIVLPQVTYAGVPVQADPGGDPIEIELACNVEKAAASAIATVTTKDQNVTV